MERLRELKVVFKQVKKTVRLRRYLTSFFVYSMAVQTIMIMAIYFGTKEINWINEDQKSTGLIIAIIMIQLLAIIGAILLSKISFKIGNLNALKIVLLLWIFLCVYTSWVNHHFNFTSFLQLLVWSWEVFSHYQDQPINLLKIYEIYCIFLSMMWPRNWE